MVTIALCQLLLLGLVSGKVAQRALLPEVGELYPKFDPVLPRPQKYSLSKWTAEEVDRAHPSDDFWTKTLYDTKSENYCRDDFSCYNVTFVDCPEPWLVGHCAKGQTSKEGTFDLLGRLPSSARGAISDLLHVTMPPNMGMRYANGHSAGFGGSPSSTEGLKMMLTATWIGSPQIPQDQFAQAIAADSCNLENGNVGAALEGGLAVTAYLKLVKTPSLDASCMSTQVKFLRPYLDARWDAPGQCPNKVAPKLVPHKSILFTDGLTVLDADPVPSRVAKIDQWEKSDGYPEPCWNLSQLPKVPGGTERWCAVDDLNVYNVTYSDCPDQDPWPICRCSDARMSLDESVTKFGRLPAALRSYIRSYLVLGGDVDTVGSIYERDFFVSLAVPPDSGFMYWATQIINDEYWPNRTWSDAVSKDTCWPEELLYSDPDDIDYEVFGQTGVAYLYDSSGKSLLERGYDISCMSNGFRTLGAYAGHHYKQNSKCFKRKPNFPIVHPENSSRLAQSFAFTDLKTKLSGRPPIWMEVTKSDKS
ncbi:hypothetical protein ACJ72_05951 [Emergomyces africanus]|uniref:Uncharacterized protein n=1 Tax=Emergomyces africanus TaxID=1955775 RepID=A0A1B7NSG1_9EURO|nr:hypothetical protein ACJ72_05951 [Emergomyces africanus]